MLRRAAPVLVACVLLSAAPARPDEAPDPDEQVLREHKFAVEDAPLLDFLKARSGAVDEARVKALVRQLGADDFEAREEASVALVALGGPVKPYLEAALKDRDPEVARRAGECLKRVQARNAPALAAAVVRVLAKRNPAGTVAALLAYVPAADADEVGDEVREALASLALPDGKADPALVAALADREPARRAAAGHALAWIAGQRAAVRPLLRDDDPYVRLIVALALARAGDKEAVPALIALLEEKRLKPMEHGRIEFLLCTLADDQAPTAPTGNDPAARRKYRLAWDAWWKEAGPGLRVSDLEEAARTYGFTMVSLLDRGVILDLDPANRPRLRWEDLKGPLDAQLLRNDYLLVAEFNGNVVTERDRNGKVVWQHKAEEPIVAQRLPNGNTFIGTMTRVFEVDRDGKEVFEYTPPGGAHVQRALKRRDGSVALVTELGVSRFTLIDKDKKVVRSFGVDVRTYGGRVDVLPNGHVLIPELANNRVAEYDTEGRVVWEAQIDRPINALRLPNGNTMMTSFNPKVGAIEVDPSGKEVWRYKTEAEDSRVNRALRR